MPRSYSTPSGSVRVEKVQDGYIVTVREQQVSTFIGVRDDGAMAYGAGGSSIHPVHVQVVRAYLPYVDGGAETAKKLYQGVFDQAMAFMVRRWRRQQ